MDGKMRELICKNLYIDEINRIVCRKFKSLIRGCSNAARLTFKLCLHMRSFAAKRSSMGMLSFSIFTTTPRQRAPTHEAIWTGRKMNASDSLSHWKSRPLNQPKLRLVFKFLRI